MVILRLFVIKSVRKKYGPIWVFKKKYGANTYGTLPIQQVVDIGTVFTVSVLNIFFHLAKKRIYLKYLCQKMCLLH